mgnify:CR=1 FL=1
MANARSLLVVLFVSSLSFASGDGVPAFISLVPVAVAVYFATWAPWLVTYRRHPRSWGLTADPTLSKIFGEPFAALLNYHHQMYDFHTGTYMKEATHVYEAHPAGWLIVKRPIGIDAVNDIKPGVALIAKRTGQPLQTILIRTNSPYLSKGWTLFRPPQFPLIYQASLGAQLSATGVCAHTALSLQDYFEAQMASSIDPTLRL